MRAKSDRDIRPPHMRQTSEQLNGQWQKRVVVRCSCCGEAESVPYFPAELAARWLGDRGWKSPMDAKACLRPKCVEVEQVRLEDEKKKLTQKQAAYLHFNKPKEKPVAETVKADPPRQPTREENRRIDEALDVHYDVDAQCYKQNFSDDSLAGKLNVPRAWVADIRERMFGPNVSAAKLEAPRKLADFEKRAKDAEEMAMKAAEQAEALAKEIRQFKISLNYQGAA